MNVFTTDAFLETAAAVFFPGRSWRAEVFRIEGRKAVLTPNGELLYRRGRNLLDEVARDATAAASEWVAAKDLFDGQERRRVSLPTYAFQQQRYFIEPGVRGEAQSDGDGDLVDKESAELAVLQAYLPQRLTPAAPRVVYPRPSRRCPRRS